MVSEGSWNSGDEIHKVLLTFDSGIEEGKMLINGGVGKQLKIN